MKILHTGDLHLGSFPGPEKDGQNVRFGVMKGLLDEIAEQAVSKNVDLVLIAGDLWHQAKTWADRGLREQTAVAGFVRKLAGHCPVVVMRGTPNHDSMEQFRALKAAVSVPGFAKYPISIVTEPGCGAYYDRNDEMLNVVALPGYDRAVYGDMMDIPTAQAESESMTATRVVNALALEYSAQCLGTLPNGKKIPKILMGHFTIQGCNMESGQTAFFSETEAVVDPEVLRQAGYDLTCFNHIHRPQQIKNMPVFYSGAIAQLNFNDEGQRRGFYIHELVDGSYAGSEFVELESPEFFTLRLNDGDVEDILNGQDVLGGTDLTNKIVRIRYNCTEEHQKALHHGDLERLAYAHDAFYVAEVGPTDIVRGLAGLEIDKAMTPEAALTDWLLQGGRDVQDVQVLVALARPFFDDQAVKGSDAAYSGLFLPVGISVENYRNYRKESFDFTNVKCCTINGENGVGKSSLFMDAIVDCIYEQPREGDLAGWITNDPKAKTGKITFEFMLGGDRFRIARTRSKSGKTTLGFSIWSDEKAAWVDIGCQRVKDTQARIESVIGMDCQTFKSCALIMQDQYGLFLCADKAERMDILCSILGLGVYDELEGMADAARLDKAREAKDLVRQMDAIRAGLPDMDELDADIKKAEGLVDECGKLADLAVKEVAQYQGLVDAATDANNRMAELAVKKMGLDDDVAASERRVGDLKAEIQELEATLASADAVRSDMARFEALGKQAGALKQALAGRDAIRQQAGFTDADIKTARDEIGAVKFKLTHLRADMSKLIDRKADMAVHADEWRADAEAFEAVSVEVAGMAGELDGQKAKRARIQALEADIKALNSGFAAREAGLVQEIRGLSEQAALLDTDLPCIRNGADAAGIDCQFLASAQRARQALPDARKRLEDLKSALDADVAAKTAELEAVRDGFDEGFEARYEAKRSEMDGLAAGKAKLAEYDRLTDEIRACQGKLDEAEGGLRKAEAKLEDLDGRKRDLESQLSGFDGTQAEAGACAAELAALGDVPARERELEMAGVRLANAKENLAREEEILAKLKKDAEDMTAQVMHLRRQAAGLTDLKRELAEHQRALAGHQKDKAENAEMLGGLRQTKAQADGQVAEIKRLDGERAKAELEADKYALLKLAFSQDGIRHNIVKSVIPALEATASSILGQMTGGRMSVELVTERQLKSNSKRAVTTLDVVINDDLTGRLPYMSRSGGERVKASLAVILALAETKGRQAGLQLGFVFIDEPPYLDGKGAEAYCDALEAIQRRYPDMKIMAISHDENMKSRFPQAVTVVKTANGSRVEYGATV